MERKVIRQGPNTLMVSLPIKWAKKNGIKKGDTIILTEEHGSLMIAKEKIEHAEKRTEITINASYKDTLVRGIISNLYKKGYGAIQVRTDSPEAFEKIKNAVDTLIGLEITDQKDNSILIEDISKEMDDDFENYLKKSFFILLEIGRLAEQKGDNQKEIRQLVINVRRFTDVCKRVLTKNDLFPEKDKLLYIIVWLLEKIGNEYAYLSREKTGSDKELMQFLRETNSFFRTFYEQYYGIKKHDLGRFSEEKDRLYYKVSYVLLRKNKSPVMVMHLANIVRLTYNMINPWIGLAY